MLPRADAEPSVERRAILGAVRHSVRNGLSAVVAALLLITTPVGARANNEPQDPLALGQLDTIRTCHHGVAVAPGATVATALDFNQKVRLRTLVLVDRAEPSIAPAIMRRVIEEYGRIGIVLDVTYQPITLSGTDAEQLMKETRAQLAKARVAGFELVHVFTGARLTLDGDPVAGEAYCIGGIREAKYYGAMSISVTTYYESKRAYPGSVNKTYFKGGPAIVAAHEIGHVLGALHQHGNCAENAQSALADGEATICTVMDATLVFAKLRFGRVERAVMRGFAIRYGSH